ncbi:MAG: hemagglutinin repeat-containing protein, partial [Rhodospirillaceae bacterium]|nr:hemagglutinin repeat-containing protein [Rhodospirillales bacterium]
NIANLVDPDALNARLGQAAAPSPRFFADPFAEAALLQRAALAQTGQRFFVPQATTDEQQRQALYDNAVAFAAGRTDVKLGVSFTDSQIAALSQPILWYVNDGTGVLTPVVYLPQISQQNLVHLEGGRIIADDADLRVAGQFKNTGFVNVADALSIDAGSILNERRTARETVFVTSKKGGFFGGKTSVTAVDTNVLQQGGEITAGTATLRTGGDFTNKGGQIATAGDLSIQSGGDILNEAQKSTSVVSWKVGFWGRLLGGGGQNWDLATSFTGAELMAGGSLTAWADGNLYNHASLIAATGDVSLSADRIEQDWQTAVWTASRKQGLFKSSTTMGSAVARGQVTSAEGSVAMTARDEDVFNRGSGISAGEDVNLTAARDVRLETASLSVENKSSQWGLSGFGLAGSSTKWNEVKTEAATVGAGRDVIISAGRDVAGIGAQIGAGRDLTLTAGRDVAFDQQQMQRYVDQKGWSAALSFFGSKALEAAMAGEDAGGIGKALLGENALLSRLYALGQSKDGWDVAANATYTGVEAINTLDKLAGLYTANNADLGGTLTDYGVDQVTSKGISLRIGGWTSSERWTETIRSSITAGRDLTINAGNDVALKGGTVANAGNDATVTAGRDLVLEAGKDERTSSSFGAGVSVGVGFGANGANVNAGIDASKAKAEGTTYSNAQLAAAGDVATTSGRDTTLTGANVSGATVDMQVGRNLDVTSVQNTATSEGRSGAASVSFGTGGWGGSVSAAMSDADRAFTDAPTSIIADGKLNIRTEDTTSLTGAQIASKTGDLTLDTGKLVWRDLQDHDTSSSTSLSAGYSPGAAIPGTGEYANVSADKQGITRATVGAGTIIIRNDPAAGLEGLNRDLAKAQEILSETGSKVRIVVAIPGERTGQALGEIADAIDDFVKKAVSNGTSPDRLAETLADLPAEVVEKLLDKAAQGHVATMTAAERDAAEKNLSNGAVPADEGERADMAALLRKQIADNPDHKPTTQQIATRDQLLAAQGTGPNLDKVFWTGEAGRAGLLASAITKALPADPALQKAAANWGSLNASERGAAIQVVADLVASSYGLNAPTITMVAQADFVAKNGATSDMEAGGGSLTVGGWFTSTTYVYKNQITIPNGGRVMADSDPNIRYTFSDIAGLVAHEVTHLYQQNITQSYLEGRLSPSDPSYKQAKMFTANNFLYISAKENALKYYAQPIESHSYEVQAEIIEILKRSGVK